MEEVYPDIYRYQRIVQAKLFMDAYYGEKIDIHAIADEAHFSRFHFIRLFRMAYGKTPHQYLIGVRVQKAKLLLQQGVSVKNTCYSVGFESIGSFTTLFKKATGQSPAAFQHDFHDRKGAMGATPLKFVPSCFAGQSGWIKSNFEERS